MGLTLHFSYRFFGTAAEVRRLLETWRQKAAAMNIDKVYPFRVVSDAEGLRETFPGGFFHFTSRVLCEEPPPVLREIMGFGIFPGPGCETVDIGLARFDGEAELTGPTEWEWDAFCKTQYASDPEAGGIDNFLRCHLGLIELLDYARDELGLKVKVNDESKYWDDRDVERLKKELGRWNNMIAAFAGKLKDALPPGQVEGPILKYKNFEIMEARGEGEFRKMTRTEKETDESDEDWSE